MKKLVMLCAVIATAVSVHAASFEWGGAICAEDGASTVGSGATAYLLYSDSAFGSITEFNTETKTTDAGGTLRQTHAITASEAGAYGFSEVYTADWSSMNGFYAVVMVDGANMYYNTFQVTEFTSATTPSQDYKVNMDWSGSDFLGDPARKGTVTGGGGDIPEPTSGLLLVLGGAMLALRRKRA